jgi:2-oxoglutarate dehydrogenase E2 component (dihydrolipoamide succinyltransferase)
MPTDIKVPSLGESVVEATVAKWYKKSGDSVVTDEPLLELETDKVTLEVPSPVTGKIEKISFNEGDTVEVGAVLGSIDETATPTKTDEPQKIETPKEPENQETISAAIAKEVKEVKEVAEDKKEKKLSPSTRKIIAEKNINLEKINPLRDDGRITKKDLIQVSEDSVETNNIEKVRQVEKPDKEERIKMSRLRQTIAKRLKDAQNNAAILTTFNEVDMYELIRTRNEHKESFEKKYGVKLGFMSFFVKACITALKDVPDVNAEIEDNEVVYKNYYNIGVAVGTDQGLVVPVVKDADKKTLIEIEKEIFGLGEKARNGKLNISDMQGGTFTISNGGVYGSLMSTPILNPPQSGVLGMHKIEERPIAMNGKVVIRPMMYLALSYDHRLVDGKGAVTFLVRVKESLEDPSRILLGV